MAERDSSVDSDAGATNVTSGYVIMAETSLPSGGHHFFCMSLAGNVGAVTAKALLWDNDLGQNMLETFAESSHIDLRYPGGGMVAAYDTSDSECYVGV